MREFTVTKPQTLRDLAIQLYGSWQFVFKMANDNGFLIDDNLPIGTILNYDETAGVPKVKNKIISSGNDILNVPGSISSVSFGRLYNAYAYYNPLFAPAGYRLPTNAEFNTLFASGPGDEAPFIAGFIDEWLAGVLINSSDFGLSGFNAKPSGIRSNTGVFEDKGERCIYPSSDNIAGSSIAREIIYSSILIDAIVGLIKAIGVPVRFIKEDAVNNQTLTDCDGNHYDTIKIGDQVWTQQNWACTKLNDGTPIPNITDNTAWSNLTTMAYCDYDNNEGNVFE